MKQKLLHTVFLMLTVFMYGQVNIGLVTDKKEYTTKDLSLSLNLSIGTVSKYYKKIKENLNMNKKELIIYNQMKNFPEASKSELSVVTNISLPTIIKYYDKIKEIVDQELAFESIFEENENE